MDSAQLTTVIIFLKHPVGKYCQACPLLASPTQAVLRALVTHVLAVHRHQPTCASLSFVLQRTTFPLFPHQVTQQHHQMFTPLKSF